MVDAWTLALLILWGFWLLSMVAVLSLLYAYGERDRREDVLSGLASSYD